MQQSSSSPIPLIGNAGEFIHSSPDRRYEIRKSVMVNFPAVAIVNATSLAMTCSTVNIPEEKFQITRGGGPEMLTWLSSKYPDGLPVGEAVLSPSFELVNCYHVIHTNTPTFRGRTRSTVPLLKQQLVDCYRRCLEEAYKVGAASIAFPCLGTGMVLGWRRRDVSRLGLNAVRSWFKHPIHGAARRARIPGPIYFLADPSGPYEHQVDAWLTAFDDLWPVSDEAILSSIEERSKTPTMTIRTRKRQRIQDSSRRGRVRRGHITRIDVRSCFYEEEVQSQEQEQEHDQQHQNDLLDDEQDQVHEVPPYIHTIQEESPKQKPNKRRMIGRRELKSLQEGSSGDAETHGRSRERKAPRRYGFEAL